jgi:glycosyltransferase involved in cell wall biosynthesis
VLEPKEKTGMKSTRKSILVVCMLDSIHSARWLENFKETEIDFYLFPSTPNRKIHDGITKLSEDSNPGQATYNLMYPLKYISIIFWALDLVFRNRLRAFLISRIVRKFQVDIIHAMELNHAGYIVSKIPRNTRSRKTKLVATIWGSDIYWFGRFKSHKRKLGKLLEVTNTIISECERDEKLAIDLGFAGTFIKSPSFFGFPDGLLNLNSTPASSRRVILVKGYESFVGRASIALAAITQIQDEVRDFDLVVYSANFKTIRLVNRINKDSKLQIKTYRKKSLNQMQMFELFSQARIHLAVSLSDGVPSTLLESMLSGTFPIQTNTGCAEQWVTDAQTALLVNPDVTEVKMAILRAIRDENLIDSAQVANKLTCLERLNFSSVKAELDSIYKD